MRIYKYLHSCLVIEKAGKRLLIDPGDYAFADKTLSPHELSGISAILITHSHSDHADPEAIKIVLQNNAHVVVYGDAGTQKTLAHTGIEVLRIEEGETAIEGFHVRTINAAHGQGVLSDPPSNIAFLIDGKFLDPGDSLDPILHQFRGVEALALPVVAPWDTRRNMAEFGAALEPKVIFPIHDGFIKDFFEEKQNDAYRSFFEKKGIRYQALGKGEYIDIP